ncbi:MAG TPA: DUF6088 family protein [Planctomycetota bacterium]|nr:DUF6088 family protein [Planctomycetota bacterium]
MIDLRARIEARIRQGGRGWVFSRKDLRDIAPSGPVGVILARLVKYGMIRRVGRGLFEYPEESRLLKTLLPPDLEQAAQAIARKHRWTIVPEGAMAANRLGLSTQVPAKIIYLSDGPSRKLQVGAQTILFRNGNPKDLRLEHYSSRLIAQALRFLGKRTVDEKVIRHLQRRLPVRDKARFVRDARYATDWILDVAQKIARRGARG